MQPLIMKYEIISGVTYHKHLGLFLSSYGNSISIKTICSKAWLRINMMKTLIILSILFCLRGSLWVKFYIIFTPPVLEYADTVWDTCTQYKTLQLKAIRIVTGATELVHVSLVMVYKEMGWDLLQKRKDVHKIY